MSSAKAPEEPTEIRLVLSDIIRTAFNAANTERVQISVEMSSDLFNATNAIRIVIAISARTRSIRVKRQGRKISGGRALSVGEKRKVP